VGDDVGDVVDVVVMFCNIPGSVLKKRPLVLRRDLWFYKKQKTKGFKSFIFTFLRTGPVPSGTIISN
jgi:hypothetical protein